MITVTAVIMSIIPKPTLFVKGSPNMKIPTHTAVTGSIAPKTEVSVEPIHFTALTSARLEITVGIMASIISGCMQVGDRLGMSCCTNSYEKEQGSEKEDIECEP